MKRNNPKASMEMLAWNFLASWPLWHGGTSWPQGLNHETCGMRVFEPIRAMASSGTKLCQRRFPLRLDGQQTVDDRIFQIGHEKPAACYL